MKHLIPANNYDQAKKELDKIESGLSSKIKTEIDANDDGHYTVALIKSVNNTAELKYDHQVSIQQLNEAAFQKAEKNLSFMGYDKLIIVHNPNPGHKRKTGKVVKMTTTTATGETPQEMEARLRATIEGETAAKYADYVPKAELEAKAGAVVQSDDEIVERLKAEFELKFGPGDVQVNKEEFEISVERDGALLKIVRSNPDSIVNPADANTSKFTLNEDDKNIRDWTAYAKEKEIDIKGLTAKADIYGAIKAWHDDADNQ